MVNVKSYEREISKRQKLIPHTKWKCVELNAFFRELDMMIENLITKFKKYEVEDKSYHYGYYGSAELHSNADRNISFRNHTKESTSREILFGSAINFKDSNIIKQFRKELENIIQKLNRKYSKTFVSIEKDIYNKGFERFKINIYLDQRFGTSYSTFTISLIPRYSSGQGDMRVNFVGVGL